MDLGLGQLVGLGRHLVDLAGVDDGDDGVLTDVSLLTEIPGVEVYLRTTPWNPQLHAIATEEVAMFKGTEKPILALGSDEPPEDDSDWQLIS